jgi:hypothetical protein
VQLKLVVSVQQKQVQESPNKEDEGPSPSLHGEQSEEGPKDVKSQAVVEKSSVYHQELCDATHFQRHGLSCEEVAPPRDRSCFQKKIRTWISKAVEADPV